VEHGDHVALVAPGISGLEDGHWLELGSGSGAFTLALADLLAGRGSILSIDRDAGALREQERRVRRAFPDVRLVQLDADFTASGLLAARGPFDGLLMSNSLHFIERTRQLPLVSRLATVLKPGGRFVVVEYDAEHGNAWVPHPVSYARWKRLAREAGLAGTRQTGRVPSRFLGAIYSAVSEVADEPR
jgi:ubiquinone/menaquinone biosynthesis C-methylase UbiE